LNLYIHFPFCRRKCSYCALYSRVGSSADARRQYIESIRAALGSLRAEQRTTIYFGGGSPALCDLAPLRDALLALSDPASPEFTVELHPLDVTSTKLDELKSIGVNRISMGVQSLDDATLRAMGRGYTADDAARAFALVKSRFDNAGIDLILGYPGDPTTTNAEALLAPLANWGLRHCSVYSLQNERGLKNVPDDDTVLDGIRAASRFLKSIGLSRYEISNYAAPGFECRHNLAVWRGEDYIGLGDGAYGRLGLVRTRNWWGQSPAFETVSEENDEKERIIFRLRTVDGLDASRHPEWIPALERFVGDGLLRRKNNTDHPVYALTERGTEVCDAILEEII
jgi:oxygen-independent coproporphyrinogen-3 oxidase